MTDDAKRLLKVFFEHLSPEDKKEVCDYFETYLRSDESGKVTMEHDAFADALSLEPMTAITCPYCGK